MKVGGIIAEYNPFHNGHSYQIENFRQQHDITHLVVVMSGNFVQRGDIAIVDKFKRSKMAILGGADLVIELPVAYALSTAESFAWGGIYLLNSLGCVDSLSFGSSSDINTLLEVSTILEELRNSQAVLELIKNGNTFPNAVSKVLRSTYGDRFSNVLDEPNNVLGIEYIRALKSLNSNIKPTTLTRKNVLHHDTAPIDNFASASAVRKLILNATDYRPYVPESSYSILSECPHADLTNLEKVILYRLRTATLKDIQSLSDVAQGLEYRILQAVKTSTTLEELLLNIKSKRYTLARIRRIILNLTLGITKYDISTMPPYARVLAMNHKGVEILSKAKRSANIPIGTSLAKLEKLSPECKRFATLESTSTDIFNLASSQVSPCALDYTHKIEIFE
jgi:predicted nucleotidyltransferase